MSGKAKLTILEQRSLEMIVLGETEKDILRELLSMYIGVEYFWSGSSVENGADCSGTCCSVLNAIYGTHIRVTADSLYRNFFTRDDKGHADAIKAAFFINEDGKAVHVATHMGDGKYLNMSSIEDGKCAHVRTLMELRHMYSTFRMEVRVLDLKKWLNS